MNHIITVNGEPLLMAFTRYPSENKTTYILLDDTIIIDGKAFDIPTLLNAKPKIEIAQHYSDSIATTNKIAELQELLDDADTHVSILMQTIMNMRETQEDEIRVTKNKYAELEHDCEQYRERIEGYKTRLNRSYKEYKDLYNKVDKALNENGGCTNE